MNKKKPIIGITTGDPKGVGPEIVSKVINLPEFQSKATFQIFGPLDRTPSLLSDQEAAEIALCSLHAGVEAALGQKIDLLVTAPVNKARLMLVDKDFRGHTEFFASKCRSKPVMMFVVKKHLHVALVTRHIPLRDVAFNLNAIDILHVIRSVDSTLKERFLINEPKIAIAGLNPHAGEYGTIGNEEKKILMPAITQARKNGINVTNPEPADTLFFRGLEGQFNAIVAMYHDQALAPIKAIAFRETVQMTLGLPFLRLSVDHGTAEAIAGQNKADITNMKETLQLALELSC